MSWQCSFVYTNVYRCVLSTVDLCPSVTSTVCMSKKQFLKSCLQHSWLVWCYILFLYIFLMVYLRIILVSEQLDSLFLL